MGAHSMSNQPTYLVFNDPNCANREILREVAKPIAFPLSVEDQASIDTLEAKFDREENCAGLAAPQIGISKQIIVFAAPDDEKIKKWRPDLTHTMPKTIWINPTYQPVGDETYTDYEGCFSVKNLAGPVARYKTISYMAYLPDGTQVKGQAKGFLARIIQHEIDHLNGTCFIDKVPQDKLFSVEEYRRMRAEEMAGETIINN